jgi:hypothetical protein
METASQKLQRIHQLWKELERTKPEAGESEALMKKIRVLSAEYQKLTEGPKQPQKSKRVTTRGLPPRYDDRRARFLRRKSPLRRERPGVPLPSFTHAVE